jgi:hypothetical protein
MNPHITIDFQSQVINGLVQRIHERDALLDKYEEMLKRSITLTDNEVDVLGEERARNIIKIFNHLMDTTVANCAFVAASGAMRYPHSESQEVFVGIQGIFKG